MCSESVAEKLSGGDDVKTTQSVAEKREERQTDFPGLRCLFAWTRSFPALLNHSSLHLHNATHPVDGSECTGKSIV